MATETIQFAKSEVFTVWSVTESFAKSCLQLPCLLSRQETQDSWKPVGTLFLGGLLPGCQVLLGKSQTFHRSLLPIELNVSLVSSFYLLHLLLIVAILYFQLLSICSHSQQNVFSLILSCWWELPHLFPLDYQIPAPANIISPFPFVAKTVVFFVQDQYFDLCCTSYPFLPLSDSVFLTLFYFIFITSFSFLVSFHMSLLPFHMQTCKKCLQHLSPSPTSHLIFSLLKICFHPAIISLTMFSLRSLVTFF